MKLLSRRALTAIDKIDHALCNLGLVKPASFKDFEGKHPKALYAGRLSRHLPQFATNFIGMTPYFASSRNIGHDVTAPLPLTDNYLDVYQSEDVFEHIQYETLPRVFDEIFRVLKPGGLFRLSVPDYGFDGYSSRSVLGRSGEIVFDPGGGGAFIEGKVINGGHLWFPTFELVRSLFESSSFHGRAEIEFLQYTQASGDFVLNPIDERDGFVQRVPGNDSRVAERPRPISIVVDARKIG